jgi:NAD(P)-dependent dehydrogenase (short-subunit alcohol dehydrogenase family)
LALKRRLEDCACLIVGGTSGIGLATARRFLDEGARVVVAGRSEQSVSEALGVLAPRGPVWGEIVDIGAPDQVEGLFLAVERHLGDRLDVLFHVAGISGRKAGDGPLHECDTLGWDTVMNTNARGLFLTNQAAVRRMRTQSVDEFGLRGTVLNMGSVLGWSPSPDFFGTYAYAASKGAIEAMTLNAAARYARDRIRFNLIAPALIDTPMAARAVGDPAIRAYLATKQPLAEGPGTPDDCAEAALYLCESASRFVTGAVLNVDGGWCVSEGQRPSGTAS